MDSWFWVVLLVLGGLVMLFYLGLPILILGQMRMDLGVIRGPIEVEEVGEGKAYLTKAREALLTRGYLEVGCFEITGMVPGVDSFCMLLVRSETGTGAMATVMRPPDLPANCYTEFSGDLEDGTNVNVLDSKSLPSADANPEKVSVQVQPGTPVDWMDEAHGRLMDGLARGRGSSRKPFPTEMSPLAFLRWELGKEMTRKVERGYWRTVDPERGVYRVTLKGAYVMTWGELWPMKSVRSRGIRRKGLRLLQDSGVEGAEPLIGP